MAYVNVAEWKPEQVTEWLKGLDNTVFQYVHSFLNNEVNGQQLLNLCPDDLDHLGVQKLGHQEIILEAVEHLRNFHYELDRENLQLLALRLACRARSLHNELKQRSDLQPLSTQTLADVAHVVMAVKPLVCWLDRSPFSGQFSYQECKDDLLHLSLQIATCAQRDRFAEKPVEEIRSSCKKLSELGDEIIQDIVDPLLLQPASLDLVTLKKRASDDLGFFMLPSFHGVHQIAEINFSSPAHQCGKIENGDEIVQVNYQTVVGWQTKKVIALFEESPTEVFLTLKKRPRHTKVYGQIYMKPYRLPSKKRSAPYSRWNDNLPSPRPELLTIPDFEIPLPKGISKQSFPQSHSQFECNIALSKLTTEENKEDDLEDKVERKCEKDDDGDDDDDDDDSFLPETADEGQASPTSMRLYLPKPRVTVQRRATVTGASPTSKRPPVNVEQFWAELRLERHWRDCGATENADRGKSDRCQLRDKSASVGNGLSFHFTRPCTTLGIETMVSKISSQQNMTLISNEKVGKTTETVQNTDVERHSYKDHCASDSHDGNYNFNSENNTVRNISFAEKNVLFEGDEILSDSENSTNTLVLYDDSLSITTPEIFTDNAYDVTCFKTLGSDFSAINFPVIDKFSSDTENYSEVVLKESLLESNEMLNDENENTVNMLQNYCLDNSNKCLESSDNEYSCEQWLQNSGKERGRLDKSYSTPAYDLLESITFLEKSVRLHEGSVRQFDGVEDERKTTEVNYCTVQSHVELNSFSHVPNILSAQPILCSDDFKSGDVKECGSGLTVAGILVPCTNKISKPSTSSLLDEKKNVFTSSQLQNSSSENQLSGNKICHLPVKSIGEKLDLHFVDNTAENASDSQGNLHVNIHSEKSCLTQETELPHFLLPDVGSGKTFSCNNNIKEISSHSSRISEKCQKSTDCDVGKVSQISLKPDAPKWPLKIIPTSAVGSGLGTRSVPPNNAIKGFPAASFSSPRSTRKRNALLSKRRKVTVKDIGCGDCEGWLLHRFRSSGVGATWLKMWFILKGTIFYGFKTPQATKAHIMIVLPGFTVCVAEEVKSRSFAFKIYHTGTVFYFAAETADELRVWLECLSVAAISQEVVKTPAGFNPQSAYFSETDEDSDCLNNSDSETNVLKNSLCKLEGTGSNNQQLVMKHHENSRNDSKKTNSPKLFGSLKKIVSKTENNGATVHSNLPGPTSSSLDRKYLNFFGGIRNINVPVPTAQFRSYRRAPKKLPVIESDVGGRKSDHMCENIGPPSRNDKLIHSFVNNIVDDQDMPTSNLKCHTAYKEDSTLMPQDFLLSDTVVTSSNKSDVNIEASKNFTAKSDTDVLAAVESREKAVLHFQKHLKVHNSRDRHIHASNPALQTSSDMLSYRLAAERLRNFGLARNQKEDTSGFMTLEKLMLSHQEEEKHKQEQKNFNHVSSDEPTSISPHQLLDQSQAHLVKNCEHTPNNLDKSGSTGVLCEAKIKIENPVLPVSKKNPTNTHHCSDVSQDIRVTLSNKQSSNTLAQNNALPTQKMVSTMETPAASNWRCHNLKAAAQYQPPPISQVLASGRKVHPKEDGPKMKFAFEMHLGENKFSTAPVKDTFSKSSKLRNLFLFTKNQNVKCLQADVPLSSSGEPNKKLTGSPRLHRTFLWEKQVYGSKNSSNKLNNFNSATYPSSSTVPEGWTADLSSPQSDCSISQVKPMMGVAMICKKPCRVGTTASPQSSSAPDYPGLEYPPVFEPETYTLSNASTLFKSRHHHSHSNNKLCRCNTPSNNQA